MVSVRDKSDWTVYVSQCVPCNKSMGHLVLGWDRSVKKNTSWYSLWWRNLSNSTKSNPPRSYSSKSMSPKKFEIQSIQIQFTQNFSDPIHPNPFGPKLFRSNPSKSSWIGSGHALSKKMDIQLTSKVNVNLWKFLTMNHCEKAEFFVIFCRFACQIFEFGQKW